MLEKVQLASCITVLEANSTVPPCFITGRGSRWCVRSWSRTMGHDTSHPTSRRCTPWLLPERPLFLLCPWARRGHPALSDPPLPSSPGGGGSSCWEKKMAKAVLLVPAMKCAEWLWGRCKPSEMTDTPQRKAVGLSAGPCCTLPVRGIAGSPTYNFKIT